MQLTHASAHKLGYAKQMCFRMKIVDICIRWVYVPCWFTICVVYSTMLRCSSQWIIRFNNLLNGTPLILKTRPWNRSRKIVTVFYCLHLSIQILRSFVYFFSTDFDSSWQSKKGYGVLKNQLSFEKRKCKNTARRYGFYNFQRSKRE